MRVITGTARGRRLLEPKGMDIRPTTDMVKEAVFNILQNDIEGRRVLDLFAGTGQLGIEALSRGAREVVFADTSDAAVKLVRENLARCGLAARVERADARAFIGPEGKFDLVFLDPPYDSALIDEILQKIVQVDILADGGIIVCETRHEKPLPEVAAPYAKLMERSYGKVKITLYLRGNGA